MLQTVPASGHGDAAAWAVVVVAAKAMPATISEARRDSCVIFIVRTTPLAEREVIPSINSVKDLDRQTSLSARIDDKGISGSLANPMRTLASAAAHTIYDAIDAAAGPDELDLLTSQIWRGYCAGAINDIDAAVLVSCIDQRRPLARNTARTAPGRALGELAGQVGSRFAPRQHPRSPDRKASRERRRTLGGSAVLPADLRARYTEGQRAVLCIVAGEVKHHGACDLPIDKIAALAGVCRTTVQTTLHEARRLSHIKITARPRPGRKNLTNVVEITSPKWLAWIGRGPVAHRLTRIGSNSPKMVSPTKNRVKKEGWRRRAVETRPSTSAK
jgi:hypothetical protein